MTTLDNTHQANSRARKKAAGLKRVEVWVPEGYESYVRLYAKDITSVHGEAAQTKEQGDE